MIKVATVSILALVGIVLLMLSLQAKAIDCVVTPTNPYDPMPMVCKYVLKVPS